MTPKARQILDGARRAFMAHGYEGASTEEIVRQAAISKGTLYSYFASKKDLFDTIIREECAKQAHTILGEVDVSMPVDQALRQLGRGMLRLLLSSVLLDLFRVAVAEAKRFPDLARAFYESGPAQGNRKMTALLVEFEKRGEIRVPNPQQAAYHFEHLCKAELFNKALFCVQDDFTDEEISRTVDAAVWAFMAIYGPRSRAASTQ